MLLLVSVDTPALAVLQLLRTDLATQYVTETWDGNHAEHLRSASFPVSPRGPIGIPGWTPVESVLAPHERRSDRSRSQQGPTYYRSDRSESFIGPIISRSTRSRGVDRAPTDRIHTLLVSDIWLWGESKSVLWRGAPKMRMCAGGV